MSASTSQVFSMTNEVDIVVLVVFQDVKLLDLRLLPPVSARELMDYVARYVAYNSRQRCHSEIVKAKR